MDNGQLEIFSPSLAINGPVLMIPATVDSREIGPATIFPPGPRPGGLRFLHVFVLSIWCGLLAGLVEVGVIFLRKQFVDVNRFYWMSRHFVWLIPLTNLLIFLALGPALSLLVFCWPRRGGYYATRLLCALTLLTIVWAAFPSIFGPAGFVFALGAAARLVPLLERHPAGFWRSVRFSFPMLTAVAAILAASVFGGDRIKKRNAETRPFPPAGSPNVLLIVLDTVAAGHLSLHGYARPTSRTIDELAQHGVRFDRARATSSWTLPSHASMFTGRWPHELSAGWLTPLDATDPTLAEYLGSQGYDTAGFVANTFYCGVDSGLARGFAQYYDYIFPELTAFRMAALVHRPLEGLRSIDDFMRSRLGSVFFQRLLLKFDAGNRKFASVINQEFLAWSAGRRQPDRPFFAFLNYLDAHYPYKLPDQAVHRFGAVPTTEREINLIEHWQTVNRQNLAAKETAFVRDSYDDCIAALDEQLGMLTDELARRGLLERTWVIITSDHGEGFGEHVGIFGHGTSLYQSQLHVPLLLIPPGRKPSKQVVSETVSLRDLAATVVDVLNLKTGAPFPGESLARLWEPIDIADRGRSSPVVSEVVVTDTLNPDFARMLHDRQVWVSLADGEWVYIRRAENTREELFNISDDGAELHNQALDPTRQSVLERMRGTLDKLTAGALTLDRFKP
jgi:arylsulfatase A-like enzyme